MLPFSFFFESVRQAFNGVFAQISDIFTVYYFLRSAAPFTADLTAARTVFSPLYSGIHTIYIRASAITPECIMQAVAIYAKARKKLGSFRVFIKYRKR